MKSVTAAPRGATPVQEAIALLGNEPDRVVIVDGGRRMTRAELLREAQLVGSALVRRGLRPGAAIGFQLPNWHEACVLNLAAVLYGFTLVPLLPMYREAELGFMLEESGAQAIFLPAQFRRTAYPDVLERVRPRRIPPERVFIVRGSDARFAGYRDLLETHQSVSSYRPAQWDAVKMVLYTSGSTGRPKGVLHSHRSIAELIDFCHGFWGLSQADLALVPSPVAHIGGSMYAFEFPLRIGMVAVLMESWQPDTALGLIEREGVSFCAGATPFLSDLVKAADHAGTALPSLRRFICGGASVPPSLIELASDHLAQCTVSRAYGSTEVPVICAGVRSRADMHHGAHTDGECGADVRLLDDDGVPVADGLVGEIVARCPRMFAGYLNPRDNEGAFTPDGFFRMGDLGRMVHGRYLEIVGRKKDIIIRLGENISPLEIENVLVQHPAILQVAIVGVPDARTGEAAVAFAVVQPGASLTLDGISTFLAARGLARQKFPEHLRIVSSLPTNTIGKVLKRELQQMARSGAA